MSNNKEHTMSNYAATLHTGPTFAAVDLGPVEARITKMYGTVPGLQYWDTTVETKWGPGAAGIGETQGRINYMAKAVNAAYALLDLAATLEDYNPAEDEDTITDYLARVDITIIRG